MAKSDLDHLIDRYLHNEVTPEEKTKIEIWLDVMKTDKTIQHHLTEREQNVLAEKLMSRIDNVEEIKAYRPKGSNSTPTRSLFNSRVLQIAASFVVIAAATAILFTIWSSSTKKITEGGHSKEILADGSIVWLKSGSKLKYRLSDDHKFRLASLNGEGLFEVAKNQDQPFKIICGDVTVLVTGTSFNLKTTSDGIDIQLFTGHVNLSSKNVAGMIDMKPKEHLIYKASGDQQLFLLDESEIIALASETDYLLTFKDTPLSDIFEKLEQKFDVKIIVENSQMKKCRIKADFTDTSLEKVFTLLKSQLDLDFKIEGKTVSVTGEGCK